MQTMDYTTAYTLLAEAYARHLGLCASTVSRKALGSGDVCKRLASGRITIAKMERALLWFKKNWPENLPWPLEGFPCSDPPHGSGKGRGRKTQPSRILSPAGERGR